MLYKDCRPLPSSRDFGHVGVLCTFSSIPAAAAGIARSLQLQLSSSLSGQGIQYDMAGGTARPTQYKSSPLHPFPLAKQGKTPCWVVSLQPLASVVKPVVSKDDCHQWIS